MSQPGFPGALMLCALSCSVFAVAQDPTTAGQSALMRLRFETFDPLHAEPTIPARLRSESDGRLWIVQFSATPTQDGRDQLAAVGVEIHGYLPDDAYVVRMDRSLVAQLDAVPEVRWVGRYHPAYRLEPVLTTALLSGELHPARYNMVVVDKHNDKPGLGAKIQGIGGIVDNTHEGSLLFTATLTADQLVKTANFDEVLWIDRWTPIEDDVDNARIQGGANYVESLTGYTGTGMNVHIYEGLHNHVAFSGGITNVLSGGASSGHGTNTAGIVFGDGTGNPQFRGFAPDVGKFYTNYSSVTTSRWNVVNALINTHNVSHTTASWGNARTTQYTSISADADDIIFDHDMVWTQSQSNAGNQDSRPQAWAKNIFSIGGFRHFDNADPSDDSWNGTGSTGPAADGRIKPTLSGYYDNIGTTSGSTGYTTSFGGTSGATPINCGHNVLAIQMFTDDSGTPGVGPFGNVLRSPGGTIHQNRPHFTTLKCLMVANATQYPFNAASTNNRREHVGWGFPNLRAMWSDRAKTLVIDETDVLTQGQTTTYNIAVPAGEDAFKAVLHYAEPAANPGASPTLINNLSLRVTSPGGTVYWGNNGLEQGNWSVAGGSADALNPIECVFVEDPQAGNWTVDVIATSIVQDNHVETAGVVDADYGLVVKTSKGPVFASFSNYGQGCPGSVISSGCPSLNQNGGSLTNNTNSFEYTFIVSNTGAVQVTSFDIYTYSNSGTLNRNAHIYLPSGSLPSTTPLATTTITVGTTPGFYTATFNPPVPVNGTFFVGYENSPNGIISNLSAGTLGTGYYRTAVTGSWTQSSLVQRPSWRVQCVPGPITPSLGNTGLPVLGTTYNVTLADAVASSATFLLTGLSDSIFQGTPLPTPLPSAPGCDIYAAPEVTQLVFTSAGGTASGSIAVTNTVALLGLSLFHQWAVFDPTVNALGFVVSDAGKAEVGN